MVFVSICIILFVLLEVFSVDLLIERNFFTGRLEWRHPFDAYEDMLFMTVTNAAISVLVAIILAIVL